MSVERIRTSRAEDTGLQFDIIGWLIDGSKASAGLSVTVGPARLDLSLELHDLNKTLAELQATRDALVAALEEQHRLRNARLAEPEDAAPGHERLETCEAEIGQAFCCRVEKADFSDPIEDALILRGTRKLGEHVFIHHGPSIIGTPKNRPDLHIGDRIEFERLGGDYIRIVSVFPATERGPAINWTELFAAQMNGEQGDEWFQERERERDSERRSHFV